MLMPQISILQQLIFFVKIVAVMPDMFRIVNGFKNGFLARPFLKCVG
jgi:hypothetical protein